MTVLNSSFLTSIIFKQEKGITTGHRKVAIANIIKDKNLSSGEEVGWRRLNFSQFIKK
ncbi:hypothetical protein [Scytonema sp. NUACC21]